LHDHAEADSEPHRHLRFKIAITVQDIATKFSRMMHKPILNPVSGQNFKFLKIKMADDQYLTSGQSNLM